MNIRLRKGEGVQFKPSNKEGITSAYILLNNEKIKIDYNIKDGAFIKPDDTKKFPVSRINKEYKTKLVFNNGEELPLSIIYPF